MTAFKTNFRSEILPDGKVIVYDVPIFAVCEKAGIKFTEDWIDRAVSYHQAGEQIGTAWAMHIHHTGEDGRTILPAGAFHNTRKGMVKTKDGELVPGVICDLVFTDEAAAHRAKLGQLLWRSPEIPLSAATGEKPPRFKSLALLDRDAPHNDDLPILTFKGGSVPNGKRHAVQATWVRTSAEPVLAFAQSEDTVFALMEPSTMAADTKKSKKPAPVVKLEDEEPKAAESEGGEGGGEGSGWKSKLDELKACEITADDIPAFLAALKEFADSLSAPAQEEPVEDLGAEAADPTEDMPMKDESPDIVKLRDEVTTLRAEVLAEKKIRETDKMQAAYESAVDAAATRLHAKGVTREEIVKFAEDEPLDRRAAAVVKFAELMDKKLLDRTADFDDVLDYAAGNRQDIPDEVLKFQAEGPVAYEHALTQHRIWSAQPDERRARIPIGRWLELNPPGGNPHFRTAGSNGGN